MILDATCGSKGMWYNNCSKEVIYLDIRRGIFPVETPTDRSPYQPITIEPTIQADNTALPFKDNVFDLIVFDPPFFVRFSEKSTDKAIRSMYVRYGKPIHPHIWASTIYKAGKEFRRVLKNKGFLLLKWKDTDKPIRAVIQLLNPLEPLVGNNWRFKKNRTWFMLFRNNGENSEFA